VGARFLVRNGACGRRSCSKNYCTAYGGLKNSSFISLWGFKAMSTFKIYILATTVLSPSFTLTSQFSPHLFLPKKTFLLVQYVSGYKLPIHIHGQSRTVVLDSGYTQSSYTEALRQVSALSSCPTVRDQDDKQWERLFLSCAPQFFKFPMFCRLHFLITVILRRMRMWYWCNDPEGENRGKQWYSRACVTASTTKLALNDRVTQAFSAVTDQSLQP